MNKEIEKEFKEVIKILLEITEEECERELDKVYKTTIKDFSENEKAKFEEFFNNVFKEFYTQGFSSGAKFMCTILINSFIKFNDNKKERIKIFNADGS